ncbi:MAG: hypothetical protein MI921_01350 [Cytophagales bacterium]|nr:hypothetical protein [Cytophagales bacterium]
MKYILTLAKTCLWLLLLTYLPACEETEDTEFDILASPVLATFEGQNFKATESVAVTATFYELDKSGILDHNIGIDSMAISGLDIRVFINGSTKIGDFVTDAEGQIQFEKSWDDIGGAGSVVRLEWVGEYSETSFRIFHNVGLE